MYSISFLMAALVSSATARSLILEYVAELPQGWTVANKAVDTGKNINFKIALRQPAADQIAAPPGAQHLTADQVRALQAPDAKDAAAVLQWLAANSITNVKQNNDIISVSTSVEKAEKLLEAKFAHYDFDNQATLLRTNQYAIPENLKGAIDFIYPITHFMDPVRRSAVEQDAAPTQAVLDSVNAASCLLSVTPECIKSLYNVKYKAPDTEPKNRLAVAGYLNEHGNHADNDDFFKTFAPKLYAAGYNFSVELVNGGQNPDTPHTGTGEAMLDLEYAMALAYPSATTFYSTGGLGGKLDDSGNLGASDNEPYLEFIQYLLNKGDDEIPHVLSTSYGDDELTVPETYARRVCDLYGLLTKRGVSVIHSSGDGGAAGGRDSNCRSKDGKHTEIAMATFPASCPWVTAIGGVTNTAEPPSGVDFSSGGFSKYFTRPTWQDKVVPAYQKAIGGLMDGYYPKDGRGIPDFSAVATNFAVIFGGMPSLIGGTSASAPLISGLISLVNDARLRKGKQSIGFLNEIMYSDKVRAVLQDITTGTSKSCSFSTGKPGGWPAKKGWDAITGLGVPKDFEKFLAVLVDA
ncbi:hypothetical protein VHEMI09351 [[Torrubiella] hemipterigena]|uniref:tripeptidyl-peptidase II n=1 Tax=[Torrubiella] hemipterigena TaxID=1531966 RepID=A0A0A1TRD2_9HYPO|nr:hypothetical protein VHEMI09351 [[Torrubiella] hemipterigena]